MERSGEWQSALSPLPHGSMERKTAFECADDEQPYLQDDAAAAGAGRIADEPFAAFVSCGGHYGFARAKIELGDVQTLAGHADPRTTRLYDRSERKVTRNLVERIKIGR